LRSFLRRLEKTPLSPSFTRSTFEAARQLNYRRNANHAEGLALQRGQPFAPCPDRVSTRGLGPGADALSRKPIHAMLAREIEGAVRRGADELVLDDRAYTAEVARAKPPRGQDDAR
jgi:hypothetical protein